MFGNPQVEEEMLLRRHCQLCELGVRPARKQIPARKLRSCLGEVPEIGLGGFRVQGSGFRVWGLGFRV